MARIDPAPIGALTSLDRQLLYLFVAGPGEGEAVALALPGSGWVFIDGCRTTNRSAERFPVEELYKRYRHPEDRVKLMALTHPHRDHMHGFDELIEEYQPKRIGLLGSEDPRCTLAQEAATLRQRLEAEGSGPSLARVHTVLRAIERAAESGSDLVSLYDGVEAYANDLVSITARAPCLDLFQVFLRGDGIEALLGRRANEFSIVLEVNYGRTQLVLGGDLIRRIGATSCPSGWDKVMHDHPGLAYHVGLKIPHHCSQEAIHPDLMGAFETQRAWCATPYNSSSIPNPTGGNGLEQALGGESPIMLTALPISRDNQPSSGSGTMRLSDMRSLLHQLKGDTFSSSDQVYRAPSRLDPLDPIWAVAFTGDGKITGRWRGNVAFEVAAD